MARFVIASLVLSAVATAVLNLVAWAGRRRAQPRWRWEPPGDPYERYEPPQAARPRVRVYFPWKGMLLASLGLTILLNLVLALR